MKDLKKTDINNLKFIHELEVHQIEIEMQNSQLQKSNDDLIISETKYRRLFESAQDGILILDAESGLITDVNPYLIEMLGYSKEEFIKKTLWEIGFFKDIGSNEEKFLELRRKEYIRYEDMPLETFDGKKKYVEFVRETYFKQIDKLGEDYKKAVRQIMNERKKNMLRDLRKLKLKKIEKFCKSYKFCDFYPPPFFFFKKHDAYFLEDTAYP